LISSISPSKIFLQYIHIFAKGKYYKCLKIINYVGQPARSPRALPQTGVMVG